MTGSIGLSCPVSLRTQIRHGRPFNWKSLPAEDPFVSTIDPIEARSFRWAAPTRKMFLEPSVLRASGTVACPRRPCERESSFSVQSAEPVAQTTAGSQRSWDSLAFGSGGASCTGAARLSSRRMWAKHLQCGGSRRSDNRRERSVRGPLGGLRIGSRISRADRYARKGIFGGAADRHTGGRLECRASGLWVGLNAHGPRGWAAALG